MCRLLCIAAGESGAPSSFFPCLSTQSLRIRKDPKTDRLNGAPASLLKSAVLFQLPTNSIRGPSQLIDFNALFLLYLNLFPEQRWRLHSEPTRRSCEKKERNIKRFWGIVSLSVELRQWRVRAALRLIMYASLISDISFILLQVNLGAH